MADGSGNELTNVLTIEPPEGIYSAFAVNVPDDQITNSACDFWTEIAKKVVKAQKSANIVGNVMSGVASEEL